MPFAQDELARTSMNIQHQRCKHVADLCTLHTDIQTQLTLKKSICNLDLAYPHTSEQGIAMHMPSLLTVSRCIMKSTTMNTSPPYGNNCRYACCFPAAARLLSW